MGQQNQSSKGVFINGREQVVHLLRAMDKSERDKLLRNMRIKNPTLTEELVKESLSFDQVDELTDHEIRLLLTTTSPAILGLALKSSSLNVQRKVLSLAPRSFAEEAYAIMMGRIPMDRSQKAKEKMRLLMVELKKRGQITSL